MTWSVIATFSTVGEAESARSALEAAGIPTTIADENLVSANWMYSQAVGGVKLLVPDLARQSAAAILASDFRHDPLDAPDLGDELHDAIPVPQPLRCPSCGGTEARRIPRLKIFLFFSLAIYGAAWALGHPDLGHAGIAAVVLSTAFAPSHRCPSCSETWTQASPETEEGILEPPAVADRIEPRCPRCGSADFYDINYRRLKALPLLASPLIVGVILILPFLPRRRCEACGRRE